MSGASQPGASRCGGAAGPAVPSGAGGTQPGRSHRCGGQLPPPPGVPAGWRLSSVSHPPLGVASAGPAPFRGCRRRPRCPPRTAPPAPRPRRRTPARGLTWSARTAPSPPRCSWGTALRRPPPLPRPPRPPRRPPGRPLGSARGRSPPAAPARRALPRARPAAAGPWRSPARLSPPRHQRCPELRHPPGHLPCCPPVSPPAGAALPAPLPRRARTAAGGPDPPPAVSPPGPPGSCGVLLLGG